MLCLGVNSGTSADAVDCVLCCFDNDRPQLIAMHEYPIPTPLRAEILQAVETPELSVSAYQSLKHKLTQCYVQAIAQLLDKQSITAEAIAVIGVHGQTIHHLPNAEHPYTLQCVDGASIAQHFKTFTVDDFRGVDIALGGQGAPIIPGFLRYLHNKSRIEKSLFLNLGGIANATVVDSASAQLQGWDIGPANALMDIWIQAQKGKSFDHQGQWARSGTVSQRLLTKLLQDQYFQQPLPKSTGRDYFSLQWLKKAIAKDIFKPEDVQATLLELTVVSIAQALQVDTQNKEKWHGFLYGKGVYNNYLMQRLAEELPQMPLQTTQALGINPEALEGALFAWLAHCYIQKQPIDLRSVTGARSPAILGCAYQG